MNKGIVLTKERIAILICALDHLEHDSKGLIRALKATPTFAEEFKHAKTMGSVTGYYLDGVDSIRKEVHGMKRSLYELEELVED